MAGDREKRQQSAEADSGIRELTDELEQLLQAALGVRDAALGPTLAGAPAVDRAGESSDASVRSGSGTMLGVASDYPIFDDEPPASERSLTILVVDDDPAGRRALGRYLGSHQIIEAGSFEEAVEQLEQREQLDVVISDNAMPGDYSGVDVMDAARVLRPEARRLMLSGHRPGELQALTARGVIDRFFAKPLIASTASALLAYLEADADHER